MVFRATQISLHPIQRAAATGDYMLGMSDRLCIGARRVLDSRQLYATRPRGAVFLATTSVGLLKYGLLNRLRQQLERVAVLNLAGVPVVKSVSLQVLRPELRAKKPCVTCDTLIFRTCSTLNMLLHHAARLHNLVNLIILH